MLDPTGNQSSPCLPNLPCQSMTLPLPKEGVRKLRRGEVKEKKEESSSLYSQRIPQGGYPFLLPKEGQLSCVGLGAW